MTGRKITLRNVGSNIAIFKYKTLSNLIWEYQVELLPGQTKIIFCVDGTFSYDSNLYNISVIENIPFPPSGSTTTTTTTSPIPNQNKTLIQLSSISSANTNWEYSILNYGENTILGPIDLGLDSNDWFYNINTTINGWELTFFNNSSDDVNVKFIDKDGSIVHNYSATTNSYSYDSLGNKYAYFTDYDNLKFIFTDFTNVTEYDIPSNYDSFYIDGNYDESNKVGAIVYQNIDNYSSYILFKPTGHIELYNWDDTSYNVNSLVYESSDYFVITVYSISNGQYSFMNIYNENGVLVKSENLLTNNTTSINGVSHTPSTVNPISFDGYVSGGTTSGDGSGANFYIYIYSGSVTDCIVYAKGNGYQVGDTITFNGTIFGGVSGDDNVVVTVTSVGDFIYQEYDVNFFSDGKLNLILWDYDDDKTPYLIYVYDGPNNELYTTNHNHNIGTNGYYDWWNYYTSINNSSYESTDPSEDIHINFIDGDGSWNGNLYSVDYCDIVSWYNSNKSFEVTTLANNANYDYYTSLNSTYIGESLILYSNRDTNFINYEVIQQGQHQTVQVVQTNSLDNWYFDYGWAGQKFVTSFNLQGINEYLLFIHNYDGTYIDDLYINAQSENYQYDTSYNSMIITNYLNEKTYYWNSTLNHIVTLDEHYNSWENENSYYTTLNHNNGNILLFNDNTQQSRIVTKNSISPIINISDSDDGYNFRIGKDIMAYLYINTSTNNINVKVHNLSGTLLTTVTTNEDTYGTFTIQENRVYLRTSTGSSYVHYLITSQGYKTVTTGTKSSEYEFNDWE